MNPHGPSGPQVTQDELCRVYLLSEHLHEHGPNRWKQEVLLSPPLTHPSPTPHTLQEFEVPEAMVESRGAVGRVLWLDSASSCYLMV